MAIHRIITDPAALLIVGTLLFLVYLIYQRFLHPLAKYPGPFLAAFTDFNKFSLFLSLRIDQRIFSLHQKYGPIVRIAPNELSFWNPEAVAPIYKSGKAMVKSPFFDGFKTFNPSLFGNRDEKVHALRRRQMAHSFSTSSLTDMESIFDRHVENLRRKLDKYAVSGDQFDLKDLIAFYGYDVIGELAFNLDFHSQEKDDPENLPPINDHILLGCLYGSLPGILPWSMNLSKYLPFSWLRKLLGSRQKIRSTVAQCVEDKTSESSGKTLLTNLQKAKDPETGEELSNIEINSEAFGFLVAGSHTTSGTLTLFFHHLLHNPDVRRRLEEEICQKLPIIEHGAYPFPGLEKMLPFMTACIRENFRHSPVFTMPLTRTVMDHAGMIIDGERIPRGVNVSISNYSLHHNPSIWGPDHDEFNPDRWLASDGTAQDKLQYLMHFGVGHRMCIGRNIATISIVKIITTLFRSYDFDVMDKDERLDVMTVGIGEKEGPLWCRVSWRE
ncbi:hypothetical protein DTO013E5_5013 [Penicillium roqueforti]|uniref:Cytochrome P450 n=1 Tax=Penicillium roqueforti (strain FM164) TaxID=1365484 RepID=W6QEP8_PENRF|nr:hypothetical protein CBS147337_4611 [Penicillium roqueforti]CDM34511.1 Cytochrome P450 [Penicillium roqueforti FM164]KAI2686151.1 hypothetical protein CBS147355_1638 [Penicillium roqueforti]KAI2726094.1 hypothetical protein CBS147332_2981 [Penicillium roqueforti]KAI2742890.1 hypothetical protein DTO012A1_3552 [Penicillium roqueforti]